MTTHQDKDNAISKKQKQILEALALPGARIVPPMDYPGKRTRLHYDKLRYSGVCVQLAACVLECFRNQTT